MSEPEYPDWLFKMRIQQSDRKSDPESGRNFKEELFGDEAILFTADQLQAFTPLKIREMRNLAKFKDAYTAYNESEAKIFYKQAKLMEVYEDNYEYKGEFFRYFPTYQSMSDTQLRGYFSWRTKVRQGNVQPTSLSFAFVYVYELLNRIGVRTSEEGFSRLLEFGRTYGRIDPGIVRYVKMWAKDYVVYYNLDKSCLKEVSDVAYSDSVSVLLDYKAHTADEIFASLNALSSYNFERSAFFGRYPQDVKEVVYRAYCALAAYYDKKRKCSLCEKFFGQIYESLYPMFRSAPFYVQERIPDFVYKVNDIEKYTCKNGVWVYERLVRYGRKNRFIGVFLKNIDFLMRQRYCFKSSLMPEKTTKTSLAILSQAVDDFMREKRDAARPRVEIDVSQLSRIRANALETQNKLLVEEEAPQAGLERADEIQNDTDLSGDAFRFLRCLISGEDYADFVRENGLMPSVLADSVNEYFFDRFGDTVIVFHGDNPAIIEDYLEELKGIVKA